MLDIKYFKQIDEVLEMPEWRFYPERDGGLNYIPNGEENSVYAIYIKDEVMTGGLAIYKLYLQEVIEAINKHCSDWCIDQDYYGVHATTECWYLNPKSFNLSDNNDKYDICKEKAIIYIMDHIKEKV